MTESKVNPEIQAESLDALRAMTVACPCVTFPVHRGNLPQGVLCRYCFDNGPQHNKNCEHCHGNGTIPDPRVRDLVWGKCFWGYSEHGYRADDHKDCYCCKGTRLVPRTPSSDEVEDALMGMVESEWIKKVSAGIYSIEVEWTISVDETHVQYPVYGTEGTDPRDCRLKALVALLEAEHGN